MSTPTPRKYRPTKWACLEDLNWESIMWLMRSRSRQDSAPDETALRVRRSLEKSADRNP